MTALARATAVVSTHPEATDDPRTLRWVVHHTLRDGSEAAAAPLRVLVSAGTLEEFRFGPGHVLTTLSPGLDWRAEGPAVRRAVQTSVAEQARHAQAAKGPERDALLRRVAEQVIAEVVAPVARTHGGSIDLVEASDGVVTVRLRGACRGCPISAITLHGRLERELTRRLPWVRAVRSTG